ncbi:GNAT family N-acetyltransferase [Azospirillum argentinense]
MDRSETGPGGSPTAYVARTDDELRAVFVILAIVWIKLGASPSQLFIPIGAATTYLLARIGGQPVGAVRLRRMGLLMELEKLSVIPEARWRGVSKALFEGAKEEAARSGCQEIRAYVRENHVGFWSNLGATEIGMENDRDGEPAFLMQYRLPARRI